MSIISVKNLTFSYAGECNNIFDNVSLNIESNWKLGLIGRNGRGKTTFLKLLMAEYEYSGKILHDMIFDYFPFKVKDKSQICLNLIKEKSQISELEHWKIEKEISLLDLSEDVLYKPFEFLSGGEQIKILLASLFLKNNNFLLIDEPNNHLDFDGKNTVTRYLKSKQGFILVSHDRKFLDAVVDHIMCINKANIEIQKGNFSSWYKNRQNQDNFELAKNEKLKKDINRLERSAKQSFNWANKTEKAKNGTRNSGLRPDKGYISHKAAKLMKRGKSIEKRRQAAIEEKSKLLKNAETTEPLKIFSLNHHSKKLVEFNSTSLFYGDNEICSEINFQVNQGDRIALYGGNGCGKSTILKFIAGDKKITAKGNFNIASDLKISCVPQDTSHLKGELSMFAEDKNIDETLFKTILRKLDFERYLFEKNVEEFSEGQKKKVLIAASLSENAHLYLWDEPLNFIDLFSREQIEDVILAYNPTIVFVEHDDFFIQKCATKVFRVINQKK